MPIHSVHKPVAFVKYIMCLCGPICMCKLGSLSHNNPQALFLLALSLSLSSLPFHPLSWDFISDGEAVKFVCFSSLFDAVTFDRLRKFWPISCLQIRNPCTWSNNCAADGILFHTHHKAAVIPWFPKLHPGPSLLWHSPKLELTKKRNWTRWARKVIATMTKFWCSNKASWLV